MQTAGRYYTPQKNVQKLQQSRPSMGAVTQKRDFSMASGWVVPSRWMKDQ